MSALSKIPVLLAPALRVDAALSMDLYLENIQAALVPFADRFDFEVLAPSTARGEGRLSKQWNRYFVYPRLLSRRLRERPGTVLHVLDHSYGHLCRLPVPNLVTCHGLENFRLGLRYPWHQTLWTYRVKSMRFARHVLAISGDLADDVRRFTPVTPDKLSVAYYGIDPVFSPEGPAPTSAARLAPLLQAGEKLVLHVGMNIARKNVGLVLEAVASLRNEGLPVKFVKVGPDPAADGYAEQIQRLGLQDHVINLGWMDAAELAGVYRACHVLAFPSIHEGFGRPIVEAQACGLPVVVAATDSAREIGGAAIPTHPPHDPAALAERLRAILTDPATRDDVIAKGFENVRRFSWAEHARTLTGFYEELHRAALASPAVP